MRSGTAASTMGLELLGPLKPLLAILLRGKSADFGPGVRRFL